MSDFNLREQELIELTKWPRRIALACALGAVLALAMCARAHATPPNPPPPPIEPVLPNTDLPREEPRSSTGFVYCNGPKHFIVAVVVTYPSGIMVRFSDGHMHGLTIGDLVRYADSADDRAIFAAGDCGSIAT